MSRCCEIQLPSGPYPAEEIPVLSVEDDLAIRDLVLLVSFVVLIVLVVITAAAV